MRTIITIIFISVLIICKSQDCIAEKNIQESQFKSTLSIDSNLKKEANLPSKLDIAQTNIDNRNLVYIHITNNEEYVFVNNDTVPIIELSQLIVDYLLNKNNDTLKPELKPIYIKNIGNCYQSQLVISLQVDRIALYETFVIAQGEIFRAYKEVRDAMSVCHLNKNFDELSDKEKEAIFELVPMRFTE